MDINELEKKRRSLGTLIGEWINRNKSPKDIKLKVQEYFDITNQLNQTNKNICIRSKHLTPQYWDTHTVEDYKKDKESGSLSITSQQTPQIKIVEKLKVIKEENYYILRIAWDDIDNQYKDVFDKYMQPYLQKLPIRFKTKDFSEFDNRCEWMYKYEYKGSSDAFNVIKSSIEYIAEINGMKAEIFGKQKT